jgi:hypothetical protein
MTRNFKKYGFFILLLAALFTSCKKENSEDIIFGDTVVELDAATFNGRATGLPFPILTRNLLGYGRAVSTSIDPVITRTYTTATDTLRVRVNLVGAQRSNPETFSVAVNAAFSTAIEGGFGAPGAHFELIDKTVTIPANSSFGIFRWVVRNPGFPNTLSPLVVFQLLGNANVPVSQNFQYLGYSISQP